jgi:hypothetical protein
MDRLGRLARADRDHLRQVELDARGVREHPAHGREHERVQDELPTGRRARDEATRPPRAPPREPVRAVGRRLEYGASSARTRSKVSGAASRSMTAQPASARAFATVAGSTFDEKRGIVMPPAYRERDR